MIHEDDASIVIVKRRTRRVMRVPVRVLDRRRVAVIVVVVIGAQMDMRRRQKRRDDGRRYQKGSSDRLAKCGRNHAEILSQ